MTKFAIIDIETTGGSYNTSKITEIAIIVYQNGKIIEEFESLINPECNIPPEITRITGITNDMVRDAPKFYQIAKKILDVTHDSIFVAHNVNFDYSFIREEYRSLGYSFSRKRLCTVQLSRRYYPGLRSYSLGNLIRHFNIEVKDRHRAMEDAKATLDVFIRMMEIESDPLRFKHLIKGMLQNTKLPAYLPSNQIEELPESCGVYYMADDNGRYVYIGKSINIRDRVLQHFNETGMKSTNMQRLVHSIAYKVTGSELMACLVESAEIKKFWPSINRAQKVKTNAWAIVKSVNRSGFFRYSIHNQSELEGREEVISLFKNSKAAQQYLNYLISEYQLCENINDEKNESLRICHRLQLGYCLGACDGKETLEEYNARFEVMHKKVNQVFINDMLILDEGREKMERSAILIKNGFCSAIGYLEEDNVYQDISQIEDTLEPYHGNVETNSIIRRFIKRNSSLKIIPLQAKPHVEE
ncbi:MAG: exonuclease domain-containing protein [Saprospiraceae bacterium]